MQKLIGILILCSGLSMAAQNQKAYTLNIEKSMLHWKGSYSFLFSEHTGIAKFKKGQLTTSESRITGGSFVIDMNSITNADYEQERGPVAHLKDDDFFDVTKYPEAKLVITQVKYNENDNEHEIEANLTIKKITQVIKFRAQVDGKKKIFRTRFKIDRRRWGIVYNSKLKNEAISDAIEFNVALFF